MYTTEFLNHTKMSAELCMYYCSMRDYTNKALKRTVITRKKNLAPFPSNFDKSQLMLVFWL